MTIRDIKGVIEEINASIGVIEDEIEIIRKLIKIVWSMSNEDGASNDND